jgi:LPS-assembly protein
MKPSRTNQLNINRTWSRFSLNGDLKWNDNVTNRRWEETDDTLQQLPVIEFDGVKQKAFGQCCLLGSGLRVCLFFELDGERDIERTSTPGPTCPSSGKTICR